MENTADPDNEVFNPIAEEESKSTTFGATMNFINAIVGAGIVGKGFGWQFISLHFSCPGLQLFN